MTQAHPIPDVHASGSLAVEHMTAGAVALLGADDRHDQVELRAGIDDPANAAQNSVYFSKCAETIDIDGLQARGLREQFFVRHENPPERVRANHDTHMSRTRHKTELQPAETFVASCGINLIAASAHQMAAVLP